MPLLYVRSEAQKVMAISVYLLSFTLYLPLLPYGTVPIWQHDI